MGYLGESSVIARFLVESRRIRVRGGVVMEAEAGRERRRCCAAGLEDGGRDREPADSLLES